KPTKEDKEEAFHALLELEPVHEMPLPDALGGHVWVRPLCRVVDGRLQIIDPGQPVSQAWLEGNAAEIIGARGPSIKKAAGTEVVDPAASNRAVVEMIKKR